MRTRISLRVAVAAAAVALAAVFAPASPAHAASYLHSYCDVQYGHYGDMCFYYRTGLTGAVTGIGDTYVNDVESPWVDFLGCTNNCQGQGLGIGNAAGSMYNGDGILCVNVWEHAGYKGNHDFFPVHGQGTTRYTINNERSFKNVGC